MMDRRAGFRRRVYYGGRLAFHGRKATMDCIVRNFSAGGAKIELDSPATIPDRVDLTIARHGIAYFGRVVWRHERLAGLALETPQRQVAAVPLDLALRLRAADRINRQLRARLLQLTSET